ncbi:hypothetical protein CVV68_20440 [Arthrobacter livingstonensis]|uniref:UspA domain-containing protein n=1 Tax=Arthrobacter livingstonensis TaxID=670078 RepID=A0A2V5L408_9MICC|nr:hypothetical protein CVV68_20440 [Arthrobacter livingstonensis]
MAHTLHSLPAILRPFHRSRQWPALTHVTLAFRQVVRGPAIRPGFSIPDSRRDWGKRQSRRNRKEHAVNPSNASAQPPRIVVGVDGSEASLNALRDAATLAAGLGGSVDAIAVWEAPTKPSSYQALGIGNFAEGAQQVLDRALADAFGGIVPAIVSARIEHGSAAAILTEASRGARYLVVGRRGHGGLMGVVLGSVSAASINQAHCPVIVVK